MLSCASWPMWVQQFSLQRTIHRSSFRRDFHIHHQDEEQAFVHTAFQAGLEEVLPQLLEKSVDSEEVIVVTLQKLCGPTKFAHRLWPNGPGFKKGLMGHLITQKLHQPDFEKRWGSKQESQLKSTLATYSKWFGTLFSVVTLQITLQLFKRKCR